MPRAEIPLPFAQALGPRRSEEVGRMVDLARIKLRKASPDEAELVRLATEHLPAGARLDCQFATQVSEVESHWRVTWDALSNAEGLEFDRLEQQVKADEIALRGYGGDERNPMYWVERHADEWALGYAAKIERRERFQQVEPELGARSTEAATLAASGELDGLARISSTGLDV